MWLHGCQECGQKAWTMHELLPYVKSDCPSPTTSCTPGKVEVCPQRDFCFSQSLCVQGALERFTPVMANLSVLNSLITQDMPVMYTYNT